jgi:hypothetical protein
LLPTTKSKQEIALIGRKVSSRTFAFISSIDRLREEISGSQAKVSEGGSGTSEEKKEEDGNKAKGPRTFDISSMDRLRQEISEALERMILRETLFPRNQVSVKKTRRKMMAGQENLKFSFLPPLKR